jgi:hypothetical protein
MLRILGKTTENHRVGPVYQGNDMVTKFFTLRFSYEMKHLVEIYYSVSIPEWTKTDLVDKCSEYWAKLPKIVGVGVGLYI